MKKLFLLLGVLVCTASLLFVNSCENVPVNQIDNSPKVIAGDVGPGDEDLPTIGPGWSGNCWGYALYRATRYWDYRKAPESIPRNIDPDELRDYGFHIVSLTYEPGAIIQFNNAGSAGVHAAFNRLSMGFDDANRGSRTGHTGILCNSPLSDIIRATGASPGNSWLLIPTTEALTVRDGLLPPTPAYPSIGAVISSSTVDLRWIESDPFICNDAADYMIRVSTNSDFVSYTDYPAEGSYSTPIANLAPATKYYWKISARAQGNDPHPQKLIYGDWSGSSWFVTAGSSQRPLSAQVTITGPTSLKNNKPGGWTASATPTDNYVFKWYRNNQFVHEGASYTGWMAGAGFSLRADALVNGVVAGSKSIWISCLDCPPEVFPVE